MDTASRPRPIDTSALLDLREGGEHSAEAMEAMVSARAEGPLEACEVVRAEFAAAFSSEIELDSYLRARGVQTRALGAGACWRAARAWAGYRHRGGQTVPILPEFLIAAHAMTRAERLLTRDTGFYRAIRGLVIRHRAGRSP